MRPTLLEPGFRSGKLEVVRHTGTTDTSHHVLVLCRCDCGKELEVPASDIKRQKRKSCGCLARQSRTHGYACDGKSRTYRSWQSMLGRCRNLDSYYGARGITVCERWMTFENFFADMGDRPDGTSIDRFPNKLGNYEPGNCRWATRSQQNSNTCVNRLVTWKGEAITITELSRVTQLNVGSLRHRIVKMGMSVEDAVSRPFAPGGRKPKNRNREIQP